MSRRLGTSLPSTSDDGNIMMLQHEWPLASAMAADLFCVLHEGWQCTEVISDFYIVCDGMFVAQHLMAMHASGDAGCH
jgi:hypothetical protein